MLNQSISHRIAVILLFAMGLWASVGQSQSLPPAASGAEKAVEPTARPRSDNPEIEARTAKLAVELRCLVCQNQTIADSDAPLAVDLRNQIRSQLAQGRSESEIRQYMVDRYGEFILYKPPFDAKTALLWIGPFVILAGALVALLLTIRSRRKKIQLEQFSEQELARARQLLDRTTH